MPKRSRTSEPSSPPTKRSKHSHLAEEDEEDEEQESMEEQEEEAEQSLEEEDLEPEAERGGIIKEIILENFMCHKHLKTVLGPKINFLTGPNGSGKSAVLVALAVGLGAKTSFTNRGKRLDSVIMNEQSFARITIKIANNGRDPFKPEVYRKAIVVERYLKRNGGGSYKVKDDSGKTQNSTRGEVLLLVEHYNIQVNNPCAILMQDTSRQYLAESTPKSKYNFYLLATQLSKIWEDYEFINEQVTIMKKLLTRKKKLLPLMEKEVQKLQQEYEALHQLRDLENKIKAMKDQLMWAFVKEKEKNIGNFDLDISSKRKQLEKAANSIDKIKTARDQTDQRINQSNEELKSIKAELDTLLSAKQQNENQIANINKEYHQHKTKIKDLDERKRFLDTRRNNVLKKIEQVKLETLKNTQQELAQYQNKIEELEQQQQTILQDKNRIKQQGNDKVAQIEAAEQRLDEYKHQIAPRRQQADDISKRLNVLKLKKQNAAASFGPQVPDLLNLIEKYKHKFIKPPIGPIGLQIKLKDPSWATAIEIATGSVLRSFIVDNHDDERVLKELCKQCRFNNLSMIVQKYEDRPYDIDPRSLPNHLTISQMLNCGSPIVYNVLIDQTAMHTLSLVNDRHEAERVIDEPHVSGCYLRDGSRLFINNGSRNFVSMPRRGVQGLLATSDDAKIAELSQQLERERHDLQQMERELAQAKQQVDQLQRERSEILRPLQDKDRQLNRLNSMIQEFKQKIAAESAPPSDDIEEMKENADRLARDSARLESERLETETKIKEVKEVLMPLLKTQKVKEQEIEQIKDKKEAINEEVRKIKETSYKFDEFFGKYTEKYNKLTEGIKQLELQKKEIQDGLEMDLAKIRKSGIRSREELEELNMNSAQIDREISKLETRLSTQLNNAGRKSIDEAMKELVNAKKKYRNIEKQFKTLEQFHQTVQVVLTDRVNDWKVLRSLTAKQIRASFLTFLSQKGHTGSIKFDHNQKTLDITVQLEKLRDGSHSHSQTVNSLSGGERSFSTVSLLMALWTTMETPFTAMDEFDVFMDQVSRMKSTEMLMSFARSSNNQQQFIFITPQSLQTIKQADDLHIINMFPPRG